jgi:hypothetical protein
MSQVQLAAGPPDASLSWRLRALLFLYGNANLAGCTLALLGPALLFLHVIGPGWLFITAGLYGFGWLGGHSLLQAPEVERRIEDSLTLEQTMEHLDQLLVCVRTHLTGDMNRHLDSIKTSAQEVLPRLIGGNTHNGDLFTVKETILRYLPETLANYVALPPAFRTTHALAGGKTARQLLNEQLALLDTKMLEIVTNVAGADAQALLANGRFLEMKFQQPDFLVR